MSTETASRPSTTWPAQPGARSGPLAYLRDRRLILILLLALLAGILAYQAPPASSIAIGWLGDRLFLDASQGLGAADAGTFYGDEITGSRGDRSRWTRQDASIWLPGLGDSADLTVTLRAQGWPTAALPPDAQQPLVDILANGVPVFRFQPTAAWAEYTFRLPASVASRDTLTLQLHTSATFTGDDPRPKGIRLDALRLRGAERENSFALPAARPLALLVLCGALALLALVVLLRQPTLAFVLATLLVSGLALALALARVWAATLLPWAAGALVVVLALARQRDLVRLLARLLQRYARGAALNYGLTCMVAAWLAYVAARLSASLRLPGLKLLSDSFPDSLLYGLLGMGLLLLVLVRGREGLPRLAGAIVRLIGSRRGALAILALGALVWLGYEAWVIGQLPYVGHADYADNTVVARNLARGRGWVVDYVTQFYQLYPGTTRPQETWPLLQPVWIAPFFLLFGPAAWAAKIPNLIFMALLALLIFTAGARLWDRRVGLTAALLILTNYLFFRLVIYTTSDLAFVLFSFGAIALLYQSLHWRRVIEAGVASARSHAPAGDLRISWRMLVGSAVLTGLMLLQKPSGALIAFGMGLWFVGQAGWRGHVRQPRALLAALAPVALWAALALAILAPYLLRNQLLFGKPFYSTESYDAWVLGFGDWEDIYKIYTAQAGLGGPGVPDRSWVLRWGFDVTLLKLATQARAVRNYLLPPWLDQTRALADADSQKKALLFGLGAWLALLGALGALRSRRRLLALLLLAFGPYTLFLVGYWHADEERYFLMMMPWLALLASYALWRGYDRVAAIGDGRWAPAGLALACTALALMIAPSWPYIAKKVREEPALYQADTDAYRWLRANSAPTDVAMTRLPWQLNWVSERPALMVPNTADRAAFLALARHYHVRYLVRDTFAQPSDATRQLLDGLLEDDELGIELAYQTPPYPAVVDGQPTTLVTRVYRLPATP